jgi:hypothetical protein
VIRRRRSFLVTTPSGERDVAIGFYKLPDEAVRPGDIVALAPSYRALKDLIHVGPEQKSKGQVTARLMGLPGHEDPPKGALQGKDTRLIVPATLTWGVLLTRGCDVDQGPQRQVAVIRPLALLQEISVKEACIRGEHSSLYYLPMPELGTDAGETPLFSESFVDFRFIASLHRDAFSRLARPLSLTRDAVLDLYFGWLRHTIGPQVKRKAPCSSCGTAMDVFQVAEDFLRPNPNY